MARKILLADDSVTAQNMGRRILSDAGYDVITVNNGSAALKKIPEEKPDLLILDVYMPGYGGLEVCQRVKETPETAHIPVLLTVGKLEPFKADEARRVHADAHLVKPFEASELLTALMKLEDKIVPRAEPRAAAGATGSSSTKTSERSSAKASAHSIASASKDKDKDKDTKFGDATSGWKERLKIPRPPQPGEPEATPEAAPAVSTAFRNFEHRPENQPQPATAIPVRGGIAGDITAEEIAAIAAAAAACGDRTDSMDLQPAVGAVAVEEASFASTAAPEAWQEAAPEAGVEQPSAMAEIEPVAAAEAIAAPEPAMASEGAHAELASTSANQAAAEVPVAERIVDAEVVAALESLAPVNGNGASEGFAAVGPCFDSAVDPHGEVSLGGGFASEHTVWAGSRWTAQQGAVSEAESACILEQEMDKAYAALRQSGLAGASAEPEPAEATAWSLPENHFSSSYPGPYTDPSSPVLESSEGIVETSQPAVEEAPVAHAFSGETPNIPSSDAVAVAEDATTEVAVADDAPLSQPQTWADMAWTDSPASAVVGAVESQEVQPQSQIGASIDDEPILAELQYLATQTREVLAPPEMVATMEATTSTADWTTDGEAQPHAEAVAVTEIAGGSTESQLCEAHAPTETTAAQISNAPVGDSSESAAGTPPEPQTDLVAAVASAYEMSSSEPGLSAEFTEHPITELPPIIESMIAAVDETVAADSRPEAALAAAASAGFSFRSITRDEPVSQAPVPEESAAGAPLAAPDTTPEREAELAAAWTHWKQIRESIGSPHFTSQVVSAAAAELHEIPQEAPASAQPEAAAAGLPEAESDASSIASIVDSVLADLRPKLVAEIAKKLGREKK